MKIPKWFDKWYRQWGEMGDNLPGSLYYHGLKIAWRSYRKGKKDCENFWRNTYKGGEI